MENLSEILIPGIVFSTIYGIFYLFIRRSERLAMIEKGVDASIFIPKNPSSNNGNLKFGMLFIGVGLGILIANILVLAGGLKEEVAFPSMVFLFAGVALVGNYLIDKKSKAQQ